MNTLPSCHRFLWGTLVVASATAGLAPAQAQTITSIPIPNVEKIRIDGKRAAVVTKQTTGPNGETLGGDLWITANYELPGEYWRHLSNFGDPVRDVQIDGETISVLYDGGGALWSSRTFSVYAGFVPILQILPDGSLQTQIHHFYPLGVGWSLQRASAWEFDQDAEGCLAAWSLEGELAVGRDADWTTFSRPDRPFRRLELTHHPARGGVFPSPFETHSLVVGHMTEAFVCELNGVSQLTSFRQGGGFIVDVALDASTGAAAVVTHTGDLWLRDDYTLQYTTGWRMVRADDVTKVALTPHRVFVVTRDERLEVSRRGASRHAPLNWSLVDSGVDPYRNFQVSSAGKRVAYQSPSGWARVAELPSVWAEVAREHAPRFQFAEHEENYAISVAPWTDRLYVNSEYWSQNHQRVHSLGEAAFLRLNDDTSEQYEEDDITELDGKTRAKVYVFHGEFDTQVPAFPVPLPAAIQPAGGGRGPYPVKQHFVSYFLFFAYNGVSGYVGDHWIDWEWVTIVFDATPVPRPVGIFGSAHGASSESRDNTGLKAWDSAIKTNNGTILPIQRVEGTHPLVYVAEDTHGMWFKGGNHVYDFLNNFHRDVCNDGGEQLDAWEEDRLCFVHPNGGLGAITPFQNANVCSRHLAWAVGDAGSSERGKGPPDKLIVGYQGTNPWNHVKLSATRSDGTRVWQEW